jgi:hypothetical protein
MHNQPGLLLALALSVAGCNSSPPGTYPVSGTVTFDDRPLPEGNIIFSNADGTGVPSAGNIRNGKFRLHATAGKKQVAIFATREVGELDPQMGARRQEMYIPKQYNEETTLSAPITPGGKNRFEFHLKPEKGI